MLTRIFTLSVFALSEDFSIVMDTAVLGTLKNIHVKRNFMLSEFVLSGFYCMQCKAMSAKMSTYLRCTMVLDPVSWLRVTYDVGKLWSG